MIQPDSARRLQRLFMRLRGDASEDSRSYVDTVVDRFTGPGGTRIADRAIPPLAGDVTGTLGANTVIRLRNILISTTPPTDGDTLRYSAALNQWEPGAGGTSSTRWIPVTTGDVDTPEIVFDDGDVVMEEVPL